jgi:hypothetical protein
MSTEATDLGFDIDAGVSEIASGLGMGIEPDKDKDELESSDDSQATQSSDTQTAAPGPKSAATVTPTQDTPVVRTPPKSWAKEKHELWSKLPPDAQDYYEVREKQFLSGIEQYKGDAGYAKQIRDLVSPYTPLLRSQGISETDAIGYLFNAHYKLTQGSPDERRAAYESIGRDLGFVQGQEASPVDPAVQALQSELSRIKSALSAEQNAKFTEAKRQADNEVKAFAADASRPYFNEVASHMVNYINAGDDLQQAYEKAVWANPVTRQKELARLQTEEQAKLKEKSQTDTENVRRATSVNVRGQETRKAPTEPKGSMEDTLRATLSKIKDRAH